MSATWVAFARSGNPDNSLIPHWPNYTLDDRATLILDRECRLANDYGGAARVLWKSITNAAS
jgi:para-nitrobenzyl esterase